MFRLDFLVGDQVQNVGNTNVHIGKLASLLHAVTRLLSGIYIYRLCIVLKELITSYLLAHFAICCPFREDLLIMDGDTRLARATYIAHAKRNSELSNGF